MKKLYTKILKKGIAIGALKEETKILVVAGGTNDATTLLQLGFKDVLITNLAPHANIVDYAPYRWKKADLNQLDFSDDSFDFVIVSAALHHLYSPHRGLGEMLRVAKNGIIVIESCDNFLSRIARKIGFVPDYEVDALLVDGKGGVENSNIPNFIYRWTRDEVIKTTNCFLPYTTNSFYFFHHYEFPIARLKRSKNLLIQFSVPILSIIIQLCKFLLPRQANEFGFLILKGKQLKPWLHGKIEKPELNLEYIRKRYYTRL